jgi:hypothetical protein
MSTSPEFNLRYSQVDVIDAYKDDSSSFLEVPMGRFEISEKPMISVGFCNCVAIIGLKRNLAFFGHYNGIDSSRDDNDLPFGAALESLVSMQPDNVILAGACLSDVPRFMEHALEDRSLAEEGLRGVLPYAKLHTAWNNEMDTAKDIVIVPQSGLITIHNDSTWA